MQSKKTNAKINQLKHTEIFTLGENHSRHLSKYTDGGRYR